ncbi:MAG TPA: hypothetical protein VG013_00815, partial [Gemmataceae bacterium]|nr:hypothetical protein [Gemmataceae bacterium]
PHPTLRPEGDYLQRAWQQSVYPLARQMGVPIKLPPVSPQPHTHLAFEGWLDPHKVEDLWYFDGPPDSPEKLARSFAAVPHRVLFIGHMHRWLLGTPAGLLPWRGDGPVRLDSRTRHLVVVHAVWDGKCALFDTETGDLIPFGEGGDSRVDGVIATDRGN